jgi:hypothetical protein
VLAQEVWRAWAWWCVRGRVCVVVCVCVEKGEAWVAAWRRTHAHTRVGAGLGASLVRGGHSSSSSSRHRHGAPACLRACVHPQAPPTALRTRAAAGWQTLLLVRAHQAP